MSVSGVRLLECPLINTSTEFTGVLKIWITLMSKNENYNQ